ncbi:hypothetical protein Q8W71_01785 [Methylobacterium sp. NEAU 140]|uniref:hypothetical protein n=1 Tax=Methylobacterium sp. NEAU 140 TaxID=3064945 RepID=UPI00273688D5|nr:hypothetical protein [Methylobacterium sp. NEAU 140]MDP4021340.1 hypothetical protein [Methylobacterium sp. NEAU 140]
MRQFTMNIDDSLLLAAKRHALGAGITMSDLVRDLLAREVGWSPVPDTPVVAEASAVPILRAYSEGRLTRRQAMQALHLAPDRQVDFVAAMNRFAIPWPQPDPGQIDREAALVAAAIAEAVGENQGPAA